MLELLSINGIDVLEIKLITETDDVIVIVDGCRNNKDFAVLERIARASNGLAVKGRSHSAIFANNSSLMIC